MKPDYSFQNELVANVILNLQKYKKCLLAAAPASGKTEMAIKVISYMNCRTMVLAHGTTVLKNQFKQRLNAQNIVYGDIGDDLSVVLPQTAKRKSGKVDFLVIDEAHHYYKATSVQRIIKSYKPKYILLLTGSPSSLNKDDVPKIYISTDELRNYGVISSPKIELITSNFDISMDSINKEGTISNGIKSLIPEELLSIRGKTLVVASNLAHSNEIYSQLVHSNKMVTVSNYKNDPKSELLDSFRTDNNQYLIVVRRGILGFSMNNLMNIIDLSGSINIDFQYQLINRVTRVGEGKKYIKVCDGKLFSLYYSSLNLSCALVIRKYYESYDGSGRFKHRVPKEIVKQAFGTATDGNKKQPPSSILTIDIDFLINNHDNDELYCYTTIEEIKNIMYGKLSEINIEMRLEDIRHLDRNSPEVKHAYGWCQRNGRLELFFKFFERDKKRHDLTLEKSLEYIVTNNIQLRTELLKKHEGQAIDHYMKKNHKERYDQVLPPTKRKINLEDVKKAIVACASLNMSKNEFLDKYPSYYAIIRDNGLRDFYDRSFEMTRERAIEIVTTPNHQQRQFAMSLLKEKYPEDYKLYNWNSYKKTKNSKRIQDVIGLISKYEYLEDFMLNHGTEYSFAKRHKIPQLDTLVKNKSKMKWTKKHLESLISKFTYLSDFSERYPAECRACYGRKEVSKSFSKLIRDKEGHLQNEKIKKHKKPMSAKRWSEILDCGVPRVYQIARENTLLDKLLIKRDVEVNRTLKDAMICARKYSNRKEMNDSIDVKVLVWLRRHHKEKLDKLFPLTPKIKKKKG